MAKLLADFTVSQILIVAVGLILSFKGLVSFIQYFRDLYDKKFNKDYAAKTRQEELERHYENCKKQHEESMDLYNGVSEQIDELADCVNSKFDTLTQRIDDLTTSDMLNIKYDIVKDYHFFKEQKGWIDDYNLDTLERRFKIYQKEGGNSYVEGLMNELRALPKHPPTE